MSVISSSKSQKDVNAIDLYLFNTLLALKRHFEVVHIDIDLRKILASAVMNKFTQTQMSTILLSESICVSFKASSIDLMKIQR